MSFYIKPFSWLFVAVPKPFRGVKWNEMKFILFQIKLEMHFTIRSYEF